VTHAESCIHKLPEMGRGAGAARKGEGQVACSRLSNQSKRLADFFPPVVVRKEGKREVFCDGFRVLRMRSSSRATDARQFRHEIKRYSESAEVGPDGDFSL